MKYDVILCSQLCIASFTSTSKCSSWNKQRTALQPALTLVLNIWWEQKTFNLSTAGRTILKEPLGSGPTWGWALFQWCTEDRYPLRSSTADTREVRSCKSHPEGHHLSNLFLKHTANKWNGNLGDLSKCSEKQPQMGAFSALPKTLKPAGSQCQAAGTNSHPAAPHGPMGQARERVAPKGRDGFHTKLRGQPFKRIATLKARIKPWQ